MSHVSSFAPVINSESRLVILGTAPGAESLRQGRYYSDSKNQFWQIIFSIFGVTSVPIEYHKRVEFLLEKKIALWDVIDHCNRDGSLDSNIRNEQPNDFTTLFLKFPLISIVAFNGSKAHLTFNRYIGTDRFDQIIFLKLPSSSATPGKNVKPLSEKIDSWSIITSYLSSDSSPPDQYRESN